MNPPEGKSIIVGITGASGAIYAQTLLRLLDRDRRVARVHLVVTDTGLRLINSELGMVAQEARRLPALLTGSDAAKIEYLPNRDVGASIASGSHPADAMVVIPCSVGTLADIACGLASDLLARAADVCLKESRKLVLCVRETPFNRIHLENMLRAQQAGAVIMPAVPAFYFSPRTIDDLVTQFVCRVLAQLDLPQAEQFTWHGASKAKDARS